MANPKVGDDTKILRGTFRQGTSPSNSAAIEPLTDASSALSQRNKWGRRKWKEMPADLIVKRILTVLDIRALEICCDPYGLYCELREAATNYVDEHGESHKISTARYLAGKNSRTIPKYARMQAALAWREAKMQIERNRVLVKRLRSYASKRYIVKTGDPEHG